MQCSKCNFENPGDAKFCGKCGEPLKAPAPMPSAGQAVPQMLKIGILVGSIFIPLLGIIMGAIYLNDPDSEKKKVGKLWLLVSLAIMVGWCVCCGIIGMFENMHGGPYNSRY